MNRLTIIPEDKTIYVDQVALFDFDLSFIPSDVHALQWSNGTGWIEYKSQDSESINQLPDWANQAIDLWQNKMDEINAEPIPQEPTTEDFTIAIKHHLHTKAQEKNYESEYSISSYTSSDNAQWKAEADAFVAWRDDVWEYAYQEYAKFENGERQEVPIEDFINELPDIVWP